MRVLIPFPKLNQTSNFRAKTKECIQKYITDTISQIKLDECFKDKGERAYTLIRDRGRAQKKHEVSFKNGNWYEPATREITKYHLRIGIGIMLFILLFTSSCSDLMPDYFGVYDKDEILPGKRVNALNYADNVVAEGNHEISIPASITNDNWPRSDNFGAPTGKNLKIAIDLQTAKLRSSNSKLFGSIFNSDDILGPVVFNNIVVYANADKITAVNIEDSKTLWSSNLKYDSRKKMPGGNIAIDPVNNLAILTNGSNNIYAININDGTIAWTAELDGIFRTTPLIIDGKVIIYSSTGKVVAINTANGKEINNYNFAVSGNISTISNTAAIEFMNFIALPAPMCEINIIDRQNLSPITGINLQAYHDNASGVNFCSVVNSPILIENLIIVATSTGQVFAIDIQSGSPIWQVALLTQKPIFAMNNNLLIATNEDLILLNSLTGKAFWSFDLKGNGIDPSKMTNPLFVNGNAIVASDKNLFVINPTTGKLSNKIEIEPGKYVKAIAANNRLILVTNSGITIY